MTSHIVIAVYLCAATCQPQQLRVWDGDSFLIGMKHGSERVRILGLDTAEIEGKCSYEIQMAQKPNAGSPSWRTASAFRSSEMARTSMAAPSQGSWSTATM